MPVSDMSGGEALDLEVMALLEGERLDRGVALLAGISRARAAELINLGRVRLGGAVVTTASRRLRTGEALAVELQVGSEPGAGARASARPEIPHEGSPVGTTSTAPSVTAPSVTVVFEDRYLVVVDKPAGVVVHPGAGNQYCTLVQQLVGLFPDIAGAGPDALRPGVVHRLDKGTSGLLVVARTPEARVGLSHQIAAHTVARKYLALVYGELADEDGVIEAPLGRSPLKRQKVAVVRSGRPSRTRYRSVARSSSGFPATLVACRLETGRTHQIRAHFSAIGHSVVGDERYATPAQLALSRRALPGLARPWLHAAALGFTHPATAEAMSFTSALPEELVGALLLLGFSLPLDFEEWPTVL